MTCDRVNACAALVFDTAHGKVAAAELARATVFRSGFVLVTRHTSGNTGTAKISDATNREITAANLTWTTIFRGLYLVTWPGRGYT